MKCSIIIPAHNEGDKLYNTVKSIYMLEEIDRAETEIIIADDGSTDGSVDKTTKDFPNLIVSRHKSPQGTACAKCLGAESSTGDVLLFADGHTIMSKGAFTALINVAAQYGISSPVLKGIEVEDWKIRDKAGSQGIWWNLEQDFKKSWLKLSEMEKVGDNLYISYGVHGGFCAIRRDIYNEVGGWDRNNLVFGIDYGMALKCWCFGYNIYHCSNAIVGHVFKKDFQVVVPQFWQLYYNRLRILYALGSQEELERFSKWPLENHRDIAIKHIEENIKTVPVYQKRIKRTLTNYMDRTKEVKMSKDCECSSSSLYVKQVAENKQMQILQTSKPRFVTTLTNDFVPGAYALINSMNINSKIEYDMTIIEYEPISDYNKCLISNMKSGIEYIDYRELGEYKTCGVNRPVELIDRYKHNLKKPLIWKLKYNHPLIYIDCDVLCLSSIRGIEDWRELTVAKCYPNSDMFNAGIFGFEPSEEMFEMIQEKIVSQKKSVDFEDQSIMWQLFRKSLGGKLSNKLRFVGYSWNLPAHRLDMYRRKKASVKFLHYHYLMKPWMTEIREGCQNAWQLWNEYAAPAHKNNQGPTITLPNINTDKQSYNKKYKSDSFAVVSCYYNPLRSQDRYNNLIAFKNNMEKLDIPLYIIEGYKDDDQPQLNRGDCKNLITVPFKSILWHKERLLNIAIDKLPPDIECFGFFDADIIFPDINLKGKCIQALQKYPAIQPWRVCNFMRSGNQKAKTRFTSFASTNNKACGLAWCMDREIYNKIGRLYDYAIVGSGDSIMAAYFSGSESRINKTINRLNANEYTKKHMNEWGSIASKQINGNIGFLDIKIRHLYHGELRDRKYRDRTLKLNRMGFSPYSHIYDEPNLPLEWSEDAPENIKQYLINYFQNRKEK